MRHGFARDLFIATGCFICIANVASDCHCNDPYWRYADYRVMCVENDSIAHVTCQDVNGSLDDPPYEIQIRSGGSDESFGVSVVMIEETTENQYTVDLLIARSHEIKTFERVTACHFD